MTGSQHTAPGPSHGDQLAAESAEVLPSLDEAGKRAAVEPHAIDAQSP